MRQVIKSFILFLFFGSLYWVIETLYKFPKTSHWTMFVIGGLAGLVIGLINEHRFSWTMPVWKQCFYGGIIITLMEGISGVILNIWLGLNIWYYNFMTFFMGQCSLPFSIAWCVLAGVAVFLDDWLREKLFGEPRKPYNWTLYDVKEDQDG